MPEDILVDLSIRNPRDRDADKLPLETLIFEPYNSILIRAQRQKTVEFWLRIQKADASSFNQNELFAFTPSTLEQIDLVLPQIAGKEPIKRIQQFDFESQPKYSKRALVFELPPEANNTNILYFHVWSSNTVEPDLKLWKQDSYVRLDKKYSSFLSMLYASMFSLVLVNLVFFIGIRDRNYLYYALFLGTAVLALMTSSHKIYEFAMARYLAGSENTVLAMRALCLFLLALFIQHFMRLKKYSPNLYKLTELIKLIFASLTIVFFVMRPLPEFVTLVLNWAGILFSPLLFIVPFLVLQLGNRQARYILYSLIPLIIGLFIRILADSSVIDASLYTTYAFQIGVLIQALIMSIGLSERIVDLRKQRDRAQSSNRMNNQSLEIEKKHAEFLVRVKTQARENSENPENEIVHGFFEELRPLYQFHNAAIIYQIDTHMHIRVDKEVHQNAYNEYVQKHPLEIPRICHGTEISELEVDESDDFDQQSKMLIVPVFMRGQEWCGMLMNIDKNRYYSMSENDALHRYATEMIRALLAVHIKDSLLEEVRTDTITYKLNRAAIFDELEKAIKRLQYSETDCTVALVDIDNFHVINDNYGTEIGNLCLQYMATHVSKHCPDETHIGRIGGDDFLLIFDGCSITDVENQMQNMYQGLQTVSINNIAIDISVSVGITPILGAFETVRIVMKRADLALSEAKKTGNTHHTIEI
ncbi:MAG: sensor domain-containing diguanylate cyclase [Gammaproteobacteria bacterium]|nr:sensor domain-containing diguanylate cyclase [Gammaproteobacteria bacterium]NNM13450.1 GGDEF domain-containing protein [Gammaproteobacteria bacterium]